MDLQKYKFYANPPIQSKDTVKFVQLTVNANLVTKKIGSKNNSTKRKLFHYNIIPNQAKQLIVTSAGSSIREMSASFEDSTTINDSDMPDLTDDNISEVSDSFSHASKRLRKSNWYRKKQQNLDDDLDKYMNAANAKETLDRELDEYMKNGRISNTDSSQVKEEPEEDDEDF